MNEQLKYNNPVWSVGYIIFLVSSIIIFLIFLFLYNKFHLKRNSLFVLRVMATMTLIATILNRFFLCYNAIILEPDVYPGATWGCLLPSTLCSLLSLTVSILLLISSKRLRNITNCLLIMCLIVAFSYLIYPNTLALHPFTHPCDITSALNHLLLFATCVFALISKQYKISVHKWYYVPIIYAAFICYGLICEQLLNPPSDLQYLNINRPLLESFPILSSWYFLLIWLLIVYLLITIGYELIHDRKKFKVILKELIK